MPELSPDLGSFPPVKVMLVDLDPIFRLGLKTCLEASPEFEVVAEFGRASEILQRLEALQADQLKADSLNADPRQGSKGIAKVAGVDLLVWSVDVRYTGQPMTVGMSQWVRSRYPDLPLCVLLGQNDSWLLEELWQGAVDGCWLKDANQVALLAAMRQIASGQKVWDARLLNQLSPQERQGRSPVGASGLGGMVNKMRQSLGDRGLRELEGEIAELDGILAGAGLGVWERLVLEGRFREMQVARRLVQSVILPGGARGLGRRTGRGDSAPLWPTQRETERQSAATESVRIESSPDERSISGALVESVTPALIEGTTTEVFTIPPVPRPNVVVAENQFHLYKGALIEAVIAKLPHSLQNLTPEPLEIDILNPMKRQELFFIILRLIEETLDDLRFSQLSPAQIGQQRSQILRELWQRATADFFGKYSRLPLISPDTVEVQLVSCLLEELDTVELSILSKIALVESWMEHLLFQSPLQVESQEVSLGSPAAMRQAQAILENLMVRLANAVVAPLLNRFGAVEVVKKNFYDRRWITTREIERFRNALAWKYRMEQFFGEPKNIFESQVPVLILSESGIRRQELYQPRDLELQNLKGIPLLVTLALEARDAVAPPLRASFTWVGRGVVYVLTQVVGRGIGLIGRGILEGVGTAWQETRGGKRSSKNDS